MKEAKYLFTLLLLVMSFTIVSAGGKDYVGDSSCSDCHEEVVTGFEQSFHNMFFKQGEEFKCESCHGSGQEHVDSEDPSQILGKANLKKLEASCLSCHQDVMHGTKEAHVNEFGIGCFKCHKVHQPMIKGNLVKSEDKLCVKCHMDVKAKMHLPSHHPVKEGKMGCSDCHKFDGSESMTPERVNETCMSCHAQYRGPFVFEHSPVIEDCQICHDPHGAVANNLLKQNEPFLCLQCHQMHFHTNLPGYEGDYVTPNNGRAGTSTLISTKKTMVTKCTQCHAQIHGSDLPSQSISGQGMNLTR